MEAADRPSAGACGSPAAAPGPAAAPARRLDRRPALDSVLTGASYRGTQEAGGTAVALEERRKRSRAREAAESRSRSRKRRNRGRVRDGHRRGPPPPLRFGAPGEDGTAHTKQCSSRSTLLVHLPRLDGWGKEPTSFKLAEHLDAAGIAASIGSVGDAYDNALMESTIGLFKTELIKPRRPWKTLSQVELATAEWIDWYCHRRLHGEIGHIPPVEYETSYYTELTKPQVKNTI